MKMVPLGEYMARRTGSLTPGDYPSEEFELYSIPAHDRGGPEVLRGADIGSAKQVVQPGDVMISKIIPHIRRVRVVAPHKSRRQIASGEWIVFRSQQHDAKYLRHYLLSDQFHVQFMNTVAGVGGSLVRARPQHVKSIGVPVPPLDEQRRVAAILDKADSIRTSRYKVLGLLGEVAQSLFVEIFGDPVQNSRGWPTYELGELSESGLSNGAYFPKDSYAPNGVEMVHMSDVFYDQVQRGDLKRVRASDKDILKYCVTNSDLLVARRSLNYAGAAKPCLVPESNEPLLYESSLIKLRPNAKVVRTKYLFYLLGNPAYRRGVIARIVTGTTIFGVSQSNLSRVRVPLPPLAIQDRFVEKLDHLDELTSRVKESALQLDVLFPSLQSRAFSDHL